MNIKVNISMIDYTKFGSKPKYIVNNLYIKIDDNMTFDDLKNIYDIPDNYYLFAVDNFNIDVRTMVCDAKFPFIIKQNKIYYNEPIGKTKIINLINTLNLKDDVLKIRYSTGGVGDPFFPWDLIWDWLNSDYPIIDNLQNIIGFGVVIFNFFKNFRRKNNIPTSNSSFAYSILIRDMWNISELSYIYSIDKEQCKELLKFLGYKWNIKYRMYVISDQKKKEIIEQLTKVDMKIEEYVHENCCEIASYESSKYNK